MGLTSSILAVFSLCVPPTSPSSRASVLAVHVNLQFDHSITSTVIQRVTRYEAAAIWKPYGVDLFRTDRAGADLSLDVIVGWDNPQHVGVIRPATVLGVTTLAWDQAAPAPIRVSFDAVVSLLEQRRAENPLMRELNLGTALGRVLAHEIGHVLLGAPAYHDPRGLMRTAFAASDLAWGPRSTFELMEESTVRLRARIASLRNTKSLDSCPTLPTRLEDLTVSSLNHTGSD